MGILMNVSVSSRFKVRDDILRTVKTHAHGTHWGGFIFLYFQERCHCFCGSAMPEKQRRSELCFSHEFHACRKQSNNQGVECVLITGRNATERTQEEREKERRRN